jgi:putative mRNA 3-end processing factor
MNEILEITSSGLYCQKGDFHIDPWQPVKRAVITHAHADHARPGARSYLCSKDSELLLRSRLGHEANIETLRYREKLTVNSATVSLHPAGHILGSCQVQIDVDGYTSVVSGDYNTEANSTCEPIEFLRCHTFVSECTFGLPIFKWPPAEQVFHEIASWWQSNQKQGRTSILFAYSMGKAQRILANIDPTIGPILTHGAIQKINDCYRLIDVSLPATQYIGDLATREFPQGALVVAPPSADNPAWMRRFPNRSRAFVSGWMRIRGNRRRRSVDRGFILSDHSDWSGLVRAIVASEAEKIILTHGYTAEMARWLQEKGHNAEVIPASDDDSIKFDGDTV